MSTVIAHDIDNDVIETGGIAGHIVSWTVPSKVTAKQLREALSNAQIDIPINELTPARAVRRGLKKLRSENVITEIQSTPDVLVLQLNGKEVNGQYIDLPYKAQVTIENDTSRITSDDPAAAETFTEILEEAIGVRVASDITSIIQRFFNMHKADLVAIRKQGGAYFVPNDRHDLIEKLSTMMACIGGSIYRFRCVIKERSEQKTIANLLTSYMLEQVQELRDSCDNLHRDSRSDVVQRRVTKINELNTKVNQYESLIENLAAQVRAEIADARTHFLRSLVRDKPVDLTGTDIHITEARDGSESNS